MGLSGWEFGCGAYRRIFWGNGLIQVRTVKTSAIAGFLKTAEAGLPAPTAFWNRFQGLPLLRESSTTVKRATLPGQEEGVTEQRLATRQGASLYSDFKITGGRGQPGSGGAAVIEKIGAKYFYFLVTDKGLLSFAAETS
jgi:hypothetical protein